MWEDKERGGKGEEGGEGEEEGEGEGGGGGRGGGGESMRACKIPATHGSSKENPTLTCICMYDWCPCIPDIHPP